MDRHNFRNDQKDMLKGVGSTTLTLVIVIVLAWLGELSALVAVSIWVGVWLRATRGERSRCVWAIRFERVEPDRQDEQWHRVWIHGDQLKVSALIGPLGDYGEPTPTIALRTGSPAIDKGHHFGLAFALGDEFRQRESGAEVLSRSAVTLTLDSGLR